MSRLDDLARPGEILTYSGHFLSVFEPAHDAIDIIDIAHQLSHMPRFSGATPWLWSVASHSIRVARRVQQMGGTPLDQLEGLLHDSTEAYMQDLASPIKHHPIMSGYRMIERHLYNYIADKFNIRGYKTPMVSKADHDEYEWERQAMLNNTLPKEEPWVVRDVFLQLFNHLNRQINGSGKTKEVSTTKVSTEYTDEGSFI